MAITLQPYPDSPTVLYSNNTRLEADCALYALHDTPVHAWVYSILVLADVMKPCLTHLARAQNVSHPTAADSAPAGTAFLHSDKPLLVTYSNATLSEVMLCTQARGRAFRALSQHKPGSEELQDAVYKYLQRHMPSCRLMPVTDGGDGEQHQIATAHMHLIHLVG